MFQTNCQGQRDFPARSLSSGERRLWRRRRCRSEHLGRCGKYDGRRSWRNRQDCGLHRPRRDYRRSDQSDRRGESENLSGQLRTSDHGNDLLPSTFTWRYYAHSAGSIWTAPNAIQHICESTGKGGDCMGKQWLANVDLKPADVLQDIASCNLRSVSIYGDPHGDELRSCPQQRRWWTFLGGIHCGRAGQQFHLR